MQTQSHVIKLTKFLKQVSAAGPEQVEIVLIKLLVFATHLFVAATDSVKDVFTLTALRAAMIGAATALKPSTKVDCNFVTHESTLVLRESWTMLRVM